VRATIVLMMKDPGGSTSVGVCSGDAGVYFGEASGEVARRGEDVMTAFSYCGPTSGNRTLAVNPWESQ
jgi:hypothetical protein